MGAAGFARVACAAASIAALLAAGAVAQEREVLMLGIGRVSCASWLSSQKAELEGTAWLFGFWTGANVFDDSGGAVGSTSDAHGIAAAVKKRCVDDPSVTLMSAAAQTFLEMQRNRR